MFLTKIFSNSGIPLIIEYVWFFINHLEFVVTIFFKCPLVRDVALAISRKDDHSACIFCDIAMGQHFCVTHLPAYCHQNAVWNRCARNLLGPHFNNKSECLTCWHVMYHFQEETHYTVCHHWYIFHQHNQNSNSQMSITLDLTSNISHQIQLMMKWTSLMIHYQFFQ